MTKAVKIMEGKEKESYWKRMRDALEKGKSEVVKQGKRTAEFARNHLGLNKERRFKPNSLPKCVPKK